jgi:PKD repeat protein
MLRKAKPTKRFLTPMVLIILISVSFLVSIQPPSIAQGNDCPGNLVANGNFQNGLVAGPLGGGGAVSNWSRAYGSTPDVSVLGHDPGSVGMWGNLAVGEGLQQNLGGSALVSGKTYLVSLWVKWVYDANKQNYAKFKLRASSNALPSVAAVGNTIGLTGHITGPAWQPVSFIWTAPLGGPFPFLTISVENDLSNASGPDTSYGAVDDICIREAPKPDFSATTACLGDPTAFTSTAAGATSWNWNFGDGSPNGTQQNPTHTYASPGTYNVTLCINGMTNCITKPVTVNPRPPVPVITGPSTYCGNLTGTYSVLATSGVSYSWNVTNGIINGPSTGNSVSVTWAGTGTGTISVTVTNQNRCSSKATLIVEGCNVYQGECCSHVHLTTGLQSLVDKGSGDYDFTATLSTSQSNIIRVTADLISSSLTYSAPSCGTAGPVNGYVKSAPNVGNLIATVNVPKGHLVTWHGGPANLNSGTSFLMQIKFPPPPVNPRCQDYLTFCVKYTFTDSECHTCEVIVCYGPFRRVGDPSPIPDEIKDMKITP